MGALNILAISTALAEVGVGVSRSPLHMETESFRHERNALVRLTPLIRDILTRASLQPRDIDVVACVRGPGSFTGLRVGIAAAKAFADAVGARMVGLSTLAVLAEGSEDSSTQLVPVIDSAPGEVYVGHYEKSDSALTQLSPDRAVSVEAVQSWLESLVEPRVVFGPAAGAVANRLGNVAEIRCSPLDCDIADVLRLARSAAERGETTDPMSFVPEYLRLSQPEIRFRQNHPDS